MLMFLKRSLAVLTVGLHILTFCGPVRADVIDIPGGTEKTVENLPDGSSIRVIGADGNPDAASRGILTVLNQVNINQGLDVIGIVALLAQMGIHIAPTAEINVTGGLILSTLGIDKAAFLAGLNEISVSRGMNDPAMILNEGKINLDANSFLVMLASAIKNVGHIAAHGGTVIMAAGDEGILGLGGDGLVSVKITKAIEAEVMDFQGNKVSDVISNDGTISANGGIVTLTAKGSEELFDSIINHTGIIEAKSIGEKNGKIVLDGGDEGVVRVNGTLDASGKNAGAKGGTVHVLGDKVGLFEHARIDVAGYAGGGEVLVGGDYKGQGAVRNANFTYMDKDAEILADALVNGNGGKIILWSEQATRAYGTISAKGGSEAGNGGFLETSSKDYLDINGISVDEKAVNGNVGTWLLDPKFIEIVTLGGSSYNNGTNNQFANNPTGISKITPASLVGNFSVTLQANTDVTFTDAVNMTNNNRDLTVQAGRDILINANITTTSGKISMTANDSNAQSANRDAGTGDIVMASGTTLNSGGDTMTLTIGTSTSAPFSPGSMTLGGLTAAGSTITLTSAGAITQSGAITASTLTAKTRNDSGAAITLDHSGNNLTTVNLSARNAADSANAAGAISFRDTNGFDVSGIRTTSTLALTGGGAITDSGTITVGGATTLTAGATNNITLNTAANNFTGAVSIVSGNNVTLVDTNAIELGASTVSGTLGVTASGAITDSGDLSVAGTTTLAAGAGNDITLNNSNNFNTVAITTGRNVTLNDSNAIVLGASTVSGTLGVTAGGAITDSGNLAVTGTTTLAAGSGNNITLDNNNNFSTVAITSGNNVTLVDTNAIELGASTVSGTLGVTASGAITDSGDLSVAGTTTLAAGAGNDITLNNSNNFNTVAITTGRNVTLNDSNAIVLGASTVSGTLGVTAGGAITDSGNLAVTGTTTLAAGSGNNITLDNNNNFSTVAITSGNNVSLKDTGAITLGASTVSGTLGVTASGAITDSGDLSVAGTTTLAAGAGNDITLNNSNNFNTVAITTGRNVTLNDSNAIDLGTSTVSGTLSVTAGGDITQSGALTATGGNSTFTVTGASKNVLLGTQANHFAGRTVTMTTSGAGASIQDVSFRNADATAIAPTMPSTLRNLTLQFDAAPVALAARTLTGDLNVTAGGAITDTGNLTVAGTTTLAAGATNDITLNNSNNFGTVAVTTGRNVTLVDTNAIDLGASTVSGTLSVTAGSDITQSGALSVTSGSSTFTINTGANKNVLLGTEANHFGSQAVTITTSGGGSIQDVSFRNVDGSPASPTFPSSLRNLTLQFDSAGVALSGTTLTGDLSVTAGGAITQTGALSVTGATTLAAGSGNNITLDTATNNLVGAVSVVSGNNVKIVDAAALDFGASTISGNLDATGSGITDSGTLNVTGTTKLTAGANDIALDEAGNTLGGTVTVVSGKDVTLVDTGSLDVGASTITGDLDLTGAGITDSGTLSVTGTTRLTAGANDIVLDEAGNTLGGTVTIVSGKDVTLVDTGLLDLGFSTVTGDLDLTGAGITDSGTLNVTGTTSLTAGSNDIVLDDVANSLNGTVTVGSGNNVTIVNTAALGLGASTISGNLDATGAGITQSDGITVNGTTKMTAGAGNNILLTDGDNSLGGAVSVVSGNDVTIVNSGATDLGDLNVSGNLNVTSDGAMTDSGTILVAGTTTLDAGSANDIELNTVSNDFEAAVTVTGAKNVTLVDADDITLGDMNINNLNVTAGGLISDSGTIRLDGTLTLNAGAGNDVVLDAAANDFSSTVSITAANNVTLVNGNATELGTSTVSGNLDVTSGGDITDTGVLSVTGTTTLSAGGNNIILDEGSNDFTGAVKMTNVNDATLADTNAIKLGASTISGNLDVTAGGAITDTGKLVVDGTATFTTNASSNITLDQANNNFKSAVNVVSAKNVTLVDTNKIELGDISISGKLDVTAGGTITGNGTLDIGNTTTLDSNGNNIKLEGTTNDFQGSISIVNGNNVTLVASDAVDMAASTVNGDLKITAGGAITDSGALTIAGTTTLDATGTGGELGVAKNIRLDDGGNSFGGAIDIVNGNNVTLVNGVGAIKLNTSNVVGNLDVTANGNITDIGTITVAGTTTLDATGNNINFNDINNDFTGAVKITSGNDVTLVDQNDLKIGASTVSGDLKLTANGLISDVGAITVTGITTLDAGAGNNITLNNAANDFTGAVKITNANDVTLVDATALKIGASTVSGDLNVTANGNITDTGTITVTGITTLDATGNNITLNSTANDFTGAVKIANANDVTLVDATDLKMGASTVSGDLKLTAGGAITDSGNISASTLEFSAGTSVTLDRAGNDFDTVAGTASGNVTIVDTDEITIGTVGATTGIDAGAGTISIQGGGDVTLTGIQTTSAATNAVVITSTGGAIIDGGDAVTDIQASGTLTLDAQKGAGNAADALGALETQVAGLSGETHSGDFQLDNTGGLEILTANGFTGVTIDDRPAPVDPGSIISITAASPITVSSAVTNYDGGDIVLKALGAAVTDDMTINADISAQGGNGNITLSAGNAITMGAGVTVSAEGTGSVNMTASGSDITMAGTSVISTEDGDISITAANDFVVGTVNADSNADGIAGDITTVSTAGSTTKAIVTTADTFTADALNMTAGGDIGQATNRIFYTANTIVTTAGGSVYVGPEPTPPAPTPSGTSAETRSEVALAIQVLFNNPNPVFLDQYGRLDGRYAFDMPPAGNVDNFSFIPMIGISTSGIDVMPILGVGIVPLGVPLPPPAVPPVPMPVPSEELPPLVVPLPTLAQPPVYGASGEGLQPIYLSLGRGNNVPALFVPWQPLGSTGSADQGLGTDAGNPPFQVSSLSKMVSMVRDRIRQMQSPIEPGEGLVGGGTGIPPAPMGSETSGT